VRVSVTQRSVCLLLALNSGQELELPSEPSERDSQPALREIHRERRRGARNED